MSSNAFNSWLNSRSEAADSIKRNFEVRSLPDGRVWVCPKKNFRNVEARVYSDMQSFVEDALAQNSSSQ